MSGGDIRSPAAEALGKIGKETVTALTQALADNVWDVRKAAAEALEKIKS